MSRRIHLSAPEPRVLALEAHRCASHGERRRKEREAIEATTQALRAELSPQELRLWWKEEAEANG